MCTVSTLLLEQQVLGSFTEPVEFNGLILGDIFEHIFIFFNFYFYFILLYNTVLVLPYIDMNPPQVYMLSQT